MIRILTDSASDILPAEAEQLGVTVIPLNVTLEDGTVLRDGVDMTPTVYYGVMARCHKLPTTSQPSPELFQRFFLEAAAAGDEVVGIFLSHELSGTCQCARLAADMANVDNVLFVDSENVCLGESLLVRLAVQLRDAGKTAGQIAATLEHAKEHLHLVAVIDDLKYLRKGGRLPAAVAVAGGMLGIKPLITIKEGKVAMAGKARGLQLTVPKTYDVRPTADRVKESVFNIIGSKIIGAEVLDLFAGTGNLGLESWSRGAAAVTFIDASKESLRLVRSNIAKCRAEADCRVLQGSAPAVAERLAAAGELFDFAFCDPPYNKGWIEQIIALLGKKSFLRPGGYLVVERSAHNALPELPAGCELVRSSRYGETIVDFICYNML